MAFLAVVSLGSCTGSGRDEPRPEPVAAATPAVPREKAARPAKKGLIVEVQRPEDFNPLSRFEPLPSEASLVAFLGMDPAWASKVSLSSEEAKTRERRIREVESQQKSFTAQDAKALDSARELLGLHVAQAMYLEMLNAFERRDPEYPDPIHFAKAAHGMVVFSAKRLRELAPRHDEVRDWEASSLMARLRLGDASALAEARGFVERHRAFGAATRVFLAATGFAYLNRMSSEPLFTIANASNLRMDAQSRAVLSLFSGEEFQRARSWDKARAAYMNCVKFGRVSTEASGGPLFARCAGRLVEVTLEGSPLVLDGKLVELLLHFKAYERARYYTERVALAHREARPDVTQKLYEQFLKYAPIPNSLRVKTRVRLLDLALASRDLPLVEKRWLGLLGVVADAQVSAVGLDERSGLTHRTARDVVEVSRTEASQAAFLRLHELLRREFPSYAQNDEWEASLLTTLDRTGAQRLAVERSDVFKRTARSAEGRLKARRFAYELRRKALGLPELPDWNPKRPLLADADVARSFLDASVDLVEGGAPDVEAERVRFVAVYAALLAGQESRAAQMFEAAVARHPRARLAGEAASFLLQRFASDEAARERTLRVVISHQIAPVLAEHRNPRILLEETLWAKAESHLKAQELDAAGAAFVSFQKEFPENRRAPLALRRAADVSLALRKRTLALVALEKIVEDYPKSDLALEARWLAAETARAEEQSERAAEHMVAFAQRYAGEGLTRQAWLKAGQLFEKAGNAEKAASSYEAFVNQASIPSLKLEALRSMARVLRGKGDPTRALAALARVRQAGSATGDEAGQEAILWADVQTLEIHVERGARSEAESLAKSIAQTTPRTQAGLALVARARFVMGGHHAERLQRTLSEPNFVIEHEHLMATYDEARASLLAVCEVPGFIWCSAAYFEAASLAGRLGDAFRAAIPPASVEGEDPLRDAVLGYLERLTRERQVYAQKSRDSLEVSGAPDDSWRARILKLSVAGGSPP